MNNIKQMIMEVQIPKKNYHVASRSLDNVEQFTNEIRATYQYLFDDTKINQLLLDILTIFPLGINKELKPNESFTTFEKKDIYIPKEIILPEITSSIQSISLIGEVARIMKNQKQEKIQNETLVEFLKEISSEIISKRTNNNKDLLDIFKIYQITSLKKAINYKSEEKLRSFLYVLALKEQYRKYEKEVLHEIKQVLLNRKTTKQMLQESNIQIDNMEKHVYQYLH